MNAITHAPSLDARLAALRRSRRPTQAAHTAATPSAAGPRNSSDDVVLSPWFHALALCNRPLAPSARCAAGHDPAVHELPADPCRALKAPRGARSLPRASRQGLIAMSLIGRAQAVVRTATPGDKVGTAGDSPQVVLRSSAAPL